MNDLTGYNAIRDKIETGDLMEAAGLDFPGPEIRAKTGQKVNHTMLCVVMVSPYTGVKHVYLHEALGNGITTDLASYILGSYHGSIIWRPMKPEFKPEIPQIEQRAFEYAEIRVPYAYEDLVKQLFKREEIDFDACKKHLICSQYAQVCHGAKEGDKVLWPGEIMVMGRWYEGAWIVTPPVEENAVIPINPDDFPANLGQEV